MPEALHNSLGAGVLDIPLVSAPLTRKSSPKVSAGDNAPDCGANYNGRMTKPANQLRAWRKFRGISQDELAAKVDTAKGVISLLENGKRPLSDKWLHKLAAALNTRAGHLIDIDPADLDNDIVDIWTSLSAADRVQAASILRTFVKTGTDNK